MQLPQEIITKYRKKLSWRKNVHGQTSETLTRDEVNQFISELFSSEIRKLTLPTNAEVFLFERYPEVKPGEETTPTDEYLVKAEIGKRKLITYTTAAWINSEFIGVDNSAVTAFAKLPTGKQ